MPVVAVTEALKERQQLGTSVPSDEPRTLLKQDAQKLLGNVQTPDSSPGMRVRGQVRGASNSGLQSRVMNQEHCSRQDAQKLLGNV